MMRALLIIAAAVATFVAAIAFLPYFAQWSA